jgi:hypothetical protein
MLFSWRIAVNHFRNEAHPQALASRLRASGAKCNPPPWRVKTRPSRRHRPTKSRAVRCTTKSGPTQNSNSTCGTPYASNIRSGSSRTATVLSVVPTRGDSPNCLPYLLRPEHARPKPKRLVLAMSNNLCRRTVYTSGFSFTRVMIHAFCLLRRPGKAAFFLAGMRREFSFLHHRC